MSILKTVRMPIKARVYGILMRLDLGKFIILLWKMKGQNVDYLQKTALAERFDLIYRNNVWTERLATESPSGLGSTALATEQVAKELPGLLDTIGVKSLVDLGCGKYSWMQSVELRQLYVGVDIVASVIEENRTRYQDDRHRFEVLNACSDPIPDADAILCREMMFHLSFQDAKSLLRNVKGSKAKYFISTTDPNTTVNVDVPSGGWRDINLEKRPYSLGQPMMTIHDAVPDNSARVLGVWPIASLPVTPDKAGFRNWKRARASAPTDS